jgi:UDP-glucuronate decarboxylase
VRGRSGEAYNIGTETPEISIAALAGKLIELSRDLFGYTGKLVLGASSDRDYLTDNPNRRCPILAKARTELGYEPAFGPDEGLRRTMIWYSENQVATDS